MNLNYIMRKYIGRIIVLFTAMILLTACPATFDNYLEINVEKQLNELSGSWHCETHSLSIVPLLTGYYSVIFRRKGSKTPIRYNAHLTQINGVYFASIREPGMEKAHSIVEIKLYSNNKKMTTKVL